LNHLFSIRPARKAEKRPIINIIDQICAENEYLQTGHFVENDAWSALFHTPVNESCSSFLAVAEFDGRLIGHSRVYRYSETVNHPGSAVEFGFALQKSYRDRGIGQCLIRYMQAWVVERQIDSIYAYVLAGNARSLYTLRKHHFKYDHSQDGQHILRCDIYRENAKRR